MSTLAPFTAGAERDGPKVSFRPGGNDTDHSGVHTAGDAGVQFLAPAASNAANAPVVADTPGVAVTNTRPPATTGSDGLLVANPAVHRGVSDPTLATVIVPSELTLDRDASNPTIPQLTCPHAATNTTRPTNSATLGRARTRPPPAAVHTPAPSPKESISQHDASSVGGAAWIPSATRLAACREIDLVHRRSVSPLGASTPIRSSNRVSRIAR
jgi:hypothetical protein